MDFKGSSMASLHTYRRESGDYHLQHTDVYKPMLSECIGELSNSDLKLHDQWIIRRKRIIYFLTIATLLAVILCAISLIYVLPNFYTEQVSETRTIQDVIYDIDIVEPNSDKLDDDGSSPSENPNSIESGPVAQLPTLQGDDYIKLNENDFYDFCTISPLPKYQKYSKKCNSIVFREVVGMDPTLYFTDDDLNVNEIINVRITSPLSEDMVQKVLATFPNIQTLTLCIDQLCYGSKEKDFDNLPIINLPKVTTLEIVNSTLCPLASWVFTKWSVPFLEKLTITQAKFPKKVYQSYWDFLERHSKTLVSTDVKSCQCGREICRSDLEDLQIHQYKTTQSDRVTEMNVDYSTII